MPAVASRIVPTTQNPDLVSCTILVEGNKISKTHHLSNVLVRNEINKISTATVNFLDGDPSKEAFDISDSDEFVPGQKIEIQFGYHNDTTTIFKGIIITNTHKVNNDCSELH